MTNYRSAGIWMWLLPSDRRLEKRNKNVWYLEMFPLSWYGHETGDDNIATAYMQKSGTVGG